jgi:hypothetical protein
MNDSFPSILISRYPEDGTVSDLVVIVFFLYNFFSNNWIWTWLKQNGFLGELGVKSKPLEKTITMA